MPVDATVKLNVDIKKFAKALTRLTKLISTLGNEVKNLSALMRKNARDATAGSKKIVGGLKQQNKETQKLIDKQNLLNKQRARDVRKNMSGRTPQPIAGGAMPLMLTAGGTKSPGKNAIDQIKASFKSQGAMAGLAKASIAAYIGVMGVKKLIAFADAAQRINNRLAVTLPIGSSTTKIFKQIKDMAMETRQPFEEVAMMYSRITLASKRMNVTTKQAMKTTKLFSKLITIQGATAHEARSALTQFSQSLQAGKLAGDEFRSISENLPAVLRIIADETGKPIDMLKNMAEQGQLTPALMIRALLRAEKQINSMFSKTTMTMGQAANMLKTEMTGMMGAFVQSSLGAALVKGVFLALLAVIMALRQTFRALYGAVASVGNFFTNFVKGLRIYFDTETTEKIEKRAKALEAWGIVSQEAFAKAQQKTGPLDTQRQWNALITNDPDGKTASRDVSIPGGPTYKQTGLDPKAEGGDGNIDNITNETMDTLKRNMKGMVTDMLDFKNSLKDNVFNTLTKDFPAAVGSSFADMVMEGKSFSKGMKDAFKDMAKQLIAAVVKMIIQLIALKLVLAALGIESVSQITSGNIIPKGGFLGSLTKLFGFGGKKAHGGPVSGSRSYIVGEEGPELFTPSENGEITPNNQMGGGVVIQNLSIMPNSSIDQALMDKPPSFWIEMAQEKILPALNTLGQGGETTSLPFRGAR